MAAKLTTEERFRRAYAHLEALRELAYSIGSPDSPPGRQRAAIINRARGHYNGAHSAVARLTQRTAARNDPASAVRAEALIEQAHALVEHTRRFSK